MFAFKIPPKKRGRAELEVLEEETSICDVKAREGWYFGGARGQPLHQ